jgi:hypothetical protein
MALARTSKIMFIAGLLSLAVSCGVPTDNGGAVMAGSPAGAGAAQADQDLQFGVEHRFASGVTISVAAPRSFRPSATAYPSSPRAAAFDIEVANAGGDTFKLSGLSVTAATMAGTAVKQVVDTTQSINGIDDAGTDLAPGRSIHVTLAFAVPEQQTDLRLQVRPSASEQVAATYCGPA